MDDLVAKHSTAQKEIADKIAKQKELLNRVASSTTLPAETKKTYLATIKSMSAAVVKQQGALKESG